MRHPTKNPDAGGVRASKPFSCGKAENGFKATPRALLIQAKTVAAFVAALDSDVVAAFAVLVVEGASK